MAFYEQNFFCSILSVLWFFGWRTQATAVHQVTSGYYKMSMTLVDGCRDLCVCLKAHFYFSWKAKCCENAKMRKLRKLRLIAECFRLSIKYIFFDNNAPQRSKSFAQFMLLKCLEMKLFMWVARMPLRIVLFSILKKKEVPWTSLHPPVENISSAS